MLYKFLVVATSMPKKASQRGDVVSFKDARESWGKNEGPPRFALVPINCTYDEAEFICKECTYNFNDGNFVDKDSGDAFDSKMLIDSRSYYDIVDGDHDAANMRSIMDIAGDINVDNACEFLNPFPHIKSDPTSGHYKKQRVHFMKTIYSMRNLPGMDDLFTLIKHGNYGEIREGLMALPAPTRIILKNKLSKEDYDSLHNNWGAI